jgi:hypothetical protein
MQVDVDISDPPRPQNWCEFEELMMKMTIVGSCSNSVWWVIARHWLIENSNLMVWFSLQLGRRRSETTNFFYQSQFQYPSYILILIKNYLFSQHMRCHSTCQVSFHLCKPSATCINQMALVKNLMGLINANVGNVRDQIKTFKT